MAIHPTNAGEASATLVVAYFKAFFNAFEGTKLYDLLAAAPLIAWYGFCLSHQLPGLAQQIGETSFATADVGFLARLTSNDASRPQIWNRRAWRCGTRCAFSLRARHCGSWPPSRRCWHRKSCA